VVCWIDVKWPQLWSAVWRSHPSALEWRGRKQGRCKDSALNCDLVPVSTSSVHNALYEMVTWW
jgi:hypothetical protein